MKKKVIILMLTFVLAICCVAGGTLAWLTATTETVANTFTTSDISITLEESEKLDLKMVPGYEIKKDPKVTVNEGSEACWLFVKVEKSTNYDSYMTYEIADGWTLVEDETNVYARKVATTDIGTAYSILKGDKVTVKGEVTKKMMETATTNQPTLSFTAYACQLMKSNKTEFTAAEAWEQVAPKSNPAN